MATQNENPLRREIERRRTFAIISHPDAGKTTLTEKLLLYGGALREAGAVRAQKAARHATSDWLELEKQRGISVSSSVLHFDFADHRVNILDTPGHRDFSEDTYRTLMAADSAVMLIDAARGVEPQTRKLCEVCRLRKIPIFTFVNKMDRHGRDPLDIMAEIEEVLGMDVVPANWPVGAGSDFRGIYDRLERRLVLFSGGDHGTHRVEEQVIEGEPDDPAIMEAMGPFAEEVAEGIELLEGAGAELDAERVAEGAQTPMFFGSALTNFGVHPFLERFLDLEDFANRVDAHETLGIFTIGGGVPRNWAQQVAPYLEIRADRLGRDEPVRRYRYAVRICPEPEHWGGLSGCSYTEGVSWGKFVPESEGGRHVEVHADATIAWPIVVRAVIERLEAGPPAGD